MKNIITLFLMMGFLSLYAQNTADRFTIGNSDQPRDPRTDQMNFVPNEVIVKFKDNVPLKNGARLRIAGVNAVDKVLKANGVDSLVQLFPNTNGGLLRSASTPRIVKDPQGRDMIIPNLDKIYLIKVPQLRSTDSIPVNIFQFIEELKALPEVEYAEPNYIYSIDDLKPVGPILSAADVKKLQSQQRSKQSAVVPNDPLYSQQWYIPAVKADLVWEQTTGDTTQVIGILDTGVDWNHPDLKNKIWTNKDEIPNNGKDDDGNGLIDDVRGWDYINNDNNPMDDNSHGTHVAGIAAAETNNGIGIAGVCPKAKIMPVKVFQSSGTADVATIAKGIYYASNNGATVLNMSFGSYSRSLVMEDALANAYATSVLVAAVGNDNIPIGPKPAKNCEETKYASPFYPAALSFVLGVQSPEACFSNYDKDGPVFSLYADLLNYEMKAPGTNILSTVPNGGYRIFQGTSMAAPIISGAVALYRKLKPTESQELLFGNLINSIDTYVDIQKALTIVPIPNLAIVSYEISDTLDGDCDGRPDVGETIEIKVKVRNTWGQADSVRVGIDFKEYEDTTTATILTPEASVGSISAYATRFNTISLKIKLANDIADGRDICFVLKTWYSDHQGEACQDITLHIENGVELKGLISKDLILYPDKQYIVTENLAILSGVTLTIKPGTTIKLKDGKSIQIAGNIIALGTRDSMIRFTKTDLGYSWSGISTDFSSNFLAEYCIFEYSVRRCEFKNGSIKNCIFSNNGYSNTNIVIDFSFFSNVIVQNNNFYNNFLSNGIHVIYNFIYNNIISNYRYMGGAIYYDTNDIDKSLANNSIFSNFETYPSKNEMNISTSMGSITIVNLDSIYHGTTNEKKIYDGIYDFQDSGTGFWFDISRKLYRPPAKAHGIVWKVLVNEKDAQDEYDQLDPIGVAKQKFEIYFNKPMDINYPPDVSMGVRYPYIQTAINEEGFWSPDSSIYTVYKTVGINTANGINTIRISDAKDLDHFDIPIEDERFKVVVNSSGSASIGFMATPGLGKVILEWNNNNLEDGMGYNMYRMKKINDTTLTVPTIINTSLILDTLYTDYTVTPNQRYYYYYKIVRTDLSETDSSKVVSAMPMTAYKGDANGDLSVNALDVTTIVAYILNNNPQPFITEAADMNSDNNINILDVVGVANEVFNGNQSPTNPASGQQVSLYLENDTLFANTSTTIGGLQLALNGISSISEIRVLNALQNFESGHKQMGDSNLCALYYSMSGKTIPAGVRIPLLKLNNGSKIDEAIVADMTGASIPVSYTVPTILNSNFRNMVVAELGQNYPNPSKGQTILPVHIFEKVDEAAISIYNMLGQQVKVIKLDNPTVGKHEIQWNSQENKGLFIYKLEIRSGVQQFVSPLKKMIVL